MVGDFYFPVYMPLQPRYNIYMHATTKLTLVPARDLVNGMEIMASMRRTLAPTEEMRVLTVTELGSGDLDLYIGVGWEAINIVCGPDDMVVVLG